MTTLRDFFLNSKILDPLREDKMSGVIALRLSGVKPNPEAETLHHETDDEVRERILPLGGMAVTDGSEEDPEERTPEVSPLPPAA